MPILIAILLCYTLIYILFQLVTKQPISLVLLMLFLIITIIATIHITRLYITTKKKDSAYDKHLFDTTKIIIK